MDVKLWSLILIKKHRLRVLENRVLRRIFGPKGDEVTGGWGKLHNENFHNLYSSSSIIKVTKSRRMGGKGIYHECGEEECIWDIDGKTRRKETSRKTKT
jgi:hypothetical protein